MDTGQSLQVEAKMKFRRQEVWDSMYIKHQKIKKEYKIL